MYVMLTGDVGGIFILDYKKINAVLTMVIMLILTGHIVYEICAFIMLYHNPVLTRAFADSVALIAVLHMFLSVKMLFHDHEFKSRVKYLKLNARTYIQRISALGIALLIPVHFITMGLIMSGKADHTVFVILMVCQVLFWCLVGIHIAASFSNALITLGLLSDMKTRKTIDIIVSFICVILIAVSSYVIIRSQFYLFSTGGGI